MLFYERVAPPTLEQRLRDAEAEITSKFPAGDPNLAQVCRLFDVSFDRDVI